MHSTSKHTILLATIDSKQKQIQVYNDYEFSETYHVVIDNDHVAEVLRIPKTRDWQVVLREGGKLPDKTQDEILETVLNLENTNR